MKTKTFLIGLLLLISSVSFAQITITVNPIPTPTIIAQNNPSGCGLADGSVTVSGGVSYSWNTTPVQTTATATGLAAGVYVCTVTNAAGCSADISVTLTDPGAPTVTLIADDSDICAGTSVLFTAGGATTYEFFLNGVSVQLGPSNTYTNATLVNGDVVSVTGTTGGCTGAATDITMVVHDLPTPTIIAQNNPSGCGLADGSVTVSGGVSYSWNTTPVQTTATATGLAAGVYVCTVTNAAGCSADISVTLTDPGAPTGTMTSSDADNIICADESVDFIITTTATEIRFLLNGNEVRGWMSGAGANVYTTASLANGDVISAEVRQAGCVGVVPGITMTVNPLPTATFGADASICLGDSIDLTVNPAGGLPPYSVTMNNGTGDLVTPNNINPVTGIGVGGTATFSVQPTTTTTYHFTITDSNGCSRTY